MFVAKDGIIKPIIYVGVIRDHKILLVNYKSAPNPAKSGWWIPAPGLEFGEDPFEKATVVLNEFGYLETKPHIHGVESFVLPGGWHLIYHFIAHVSTDITSIDSIKSHKWVTTIELENMKDIAHEKWEIGVGKSFLQKN